MDRKTYHIENMICLSKYEAVRRSEQIAKVGFLCIENKVYSSSSDKKETYVTHYL
jgi:hypothetical protein